MRKTIVYTFLVLAFLSACTSSRQLKHPTVPGYELVWADEFEQAGRPDTTRWGYDLGDGCPKICGWGNNELQYYTADRNAWVADGRLVLEARQEKMQGRSYTSARLVSKHKGDWKYGRLEIRAKLPQGLGIWPAIWMLPTDWKYGDWPASGEIDIMEFVGYAPDSLFGTVHTQRFNHGIGTQVTKAIQHPTLSSAFHTYAIDWDSQRIDFYIDEQRYHTFRNNGEGSAAWPFDERFHLLLNVAVGGNWGGKMGVDDRIFPQRMEVEYVRVYQKKER